jgi:hypothetical protein
LKFYQIIFRSIAFAAFTNRIGYKNGMYDLTEAAPIIRQKSGKVSGGRPIGNSVYKFIDRLNIIPVEPCNDGILDFIMDGQVIHLAKQASINK